MRIAIIGAGVSGLVAAHRLHREHEITVFEAGDYAGGHTNTVAVEDAAGRVHNVDTGFIVFNDRNYPSFMRLLEELGVDSQRSNMSFGVSDGLGDFEYSGASPNGLYANRRHIVTPSFHRMVADLLRFNREARALLASRVPVTAEPAVVGGDPIADAWEPHAGTDEPFFDEHGDEGGVALAVRERERDEVTSSREAEEIADRADGPSLGDWLGELGFSETFVQRLIVPQASAVWSADPEQMSSFPAAFLFEFFENHGMLGFRGRPRWMTITGGSASYVQALTRPWRERLRLASPVESLKRERDFVEVRVRGGESERFDEVVIATHSDQALRMLDDPSDAEHEILGAIPYLQNDAILHTDVNMLPRRRRAWASWNYHLLERPLERPTVTYHMNNLQSLRSADQFCVTLNRSDEIDPTTVRGRYSYAHPVYTAAGMRAQQRWDEISGSRRTHYCGAYWAWGFHEDGVVSALRVARAIERGT